MHELVIVVFYFYMVRIGHSVFYFYMVRIGHSGILFLYGTNWSQCNSISIWYEMVIMYLLPYGTKWSQCNSISKLATEQYYIWYEMVSGYGTKLQFCGTKWLWCKIHMVRNGFWLWYEIAIVWYEMVNYGTKWQRYEMVIVRNDQLRSKWISMYKRRSNINQIGIFYSIYIKHTLRQYVYCSSYPPYANIALSPGPQALDVQ